MIFITIILTAIPIFPNSVLGVMLKALPTHLHYGPFVSRQVKQNEERGTRKSGHNETDTNKAEDGEMAAMEWDGAK